MDFGPRISLYLHRFATYRLATKRGPAQPLPAFIRTNSRAIRTDMESPARHFAPAALSGPIGYMAMCDAVPTQAHGLPTFASILSESSP
jgi:hypothetical protein